MKESFDRNLTNQANIFLTMMCNNVIKLNEIEDRKKKIKNLAEELFFNNFFEVSQLRLAIYKLTAFKMKKFEESRYSIIEEDTKKKLQEARKLSRAIIDSTIFKTLNDYSRYISIAKKAIVKLQAAFRGRLIRLITKLELMNYKIEMINEKTYEKNRNKSIG